MRLMQIHLLPVAGPGGNIAGETLDAQHRRAATGTEAGVVARRIWHSILTDEAGLGDERERRGDKQFPSPCQVRDPGGIG